MLVLALVLWMPLSKAACVDFITYDLSLSSFFPSFFFGEMGNSFESSFYRLDVFFVPPPRTLCASTFFEDNFQQH